MSVSVVRTTNNSSTAGSLSGLTVSFDATGCDFIVVNVCTAGGVPTALSGTYNSVSMSVVGSSPYNNAGVNSVGALYLANPTTGVNTVSISWTGGTPNRASIGVIGFAGTLGTVSGILNNSSSSANSLGSTVTSNSNAIVVSCAIESVGSGAITFNGTRDFNATGVDSAQGYVSGSNSVICTWTFPATDFCSILSYSVDPSVNTPSFSAYQYDWPVPRGSIPVVSLKTDYTNTAVLNTLLNVVYKKPFNQNEWPIPPGARRLVEYPYDNPGVDSLTTILHKDQFFGVAGQPPANLDWPVPKGPRQPVDRTIYSDNATLNLEEIAVLLGHRNYDWPNPKGAQYPSHLRTYTKNVNLPIFDNQQFFYAYGEAPRYDYPNPRGRPYPRDFYSSFQRSNLFNRKPSAFGIIFG